VSGRRIVVAGASRGIGAALAAHLEGQGDAVIALSRSPAAHGRWIACDLASPAAIAAAAAAIGGRVDALVFVAGIWEATAFSPDYRFDDRPAAETEAILAVNLRAPILLAQALLPALSPGAAGPAGPAGQAGQEGQAGQAGRTGRIVLIGSTSGLENNGAPEVAYNASKAGLRGAAQALAVALAGRGIGVTIINPGDVGSEGVIAGKAAGTMRPGGSIALRDVVAAVDFALGLSATATASEINLVPVP